jgi:orotidine-5'-phosphate decarboxylase
MNFLQKIESVSKQNNSLVCVGLDSQVEKIPAHIRNGNSPQFTFNKSIIDATHDLVCAYKPNSAFYEAFGSNGIAELKMTCDYLHNTYPEIPIILDAKRADIGSTNEGYAAFAFDYLGADAITLHPYLGRAALQPFLDREDKGCIMLCRTSNPGAGEFQDLSVQIANQSTKLYLHIAKKVSEEWNTNGNCLLVVGATYPDELSEVRAVAKDMTFLVPGIGAQGGDIKKTLVAGLNSQHAGLIINSSRGIIFASDGKDFASRARQETEKLKSQINSNRTLA